MKRIIKFCLLVVFTVSTTVLKANSIPENYNIVVAQDGSGDFTTITASIESLPMYCYERVTIFVKNGVYNEKFKIDRDYISLTGESRDSTRIEYDLLRENWINNKDDIGPAVVNIYADDIVIKNLTIENTQAQIGPHAFAIYGKGTRTILLDCTVLSKGGDTVSLWDYKTGMYYHDNCYFQGAVDFVCPRGWCYISNSTFYELKETAAVWHAAPTNENQKFVLQNCNFEGADSFYLARHHYDAQFYFLNCNFPETMQNKSIVHVTYKDNPQKNRPYLYGDRYFFYNCSRIGGNYSWFANNLQLWPKNVQPETITPLWTFDQKWNPIDSTPLLVTAIEYANNSLFLSLDELAMPIGNLEICSASGIIFKYFLGSGRNRIELKSEKPLPPADLAKEFQVKSGGIEAIQAQKFAKRVEKTFKNSQLR